MALIYFDTNVCMDFFLGRHERFAPSDEIAAQLFKLSTSCEFHILLSSWILAELDRHGLSEEIRRLRHAMAKKIVYVEDDADDRTAARLIPTHFDDALHIALALRHGAHAIATNNLADFQRVSDRILCISPRFL